MTRRSTRRGFPIWPAVEPPGFDGRCRPHWLWDVQVVREDMKAMETRQREDMREMWAEHRADNQALNEKLDRLLESRLPIHLQ
ncbi:MAG: hypothetical protein F4Z75_02605 [Synechococcus sp. SB0668_bin_15]|nr:hypothetical protein [Synechococcus sp. SB0668_bin_15]MXZ83672.1 hypothetical protein [Synechococcus sp. SB0666_bin_14]MYG45830.1 hypothetical protein [Synechococcus sp. SB0675_bin_6]MYK91972.1 hypothetical protein [Synechococcus sp. SB0669_bin_8]